MEIEGLRGGIWQNTCSKLTKTIVQLLFTTASNSCKNSRLFFLLRVYVSFGVSTTGPLFGKLEKFRELASGSARPGASSSRPLNPSPARGKARKPVGADPSHSEDAVTIRMSYLESAEAEESAPGWKLQQHSLR